MVFILFITTASYDSIRLAIQWCELQIVHNHTTYTFRRYFDEGHGLDNLTDFILLFGIGNPHKDRSLTLRLQLEAWISRLITKIPDGPNVFNKNKSQQ